jgi:hypothetical protein
MTATTKTRARYSLEGQKGRAQRATSDGHVQYDPADIGHRDTPIAALCARLKRETGCDCWPVREDHRTQDRDGRVTSITYEITLSRQIDHSTSSVMGSCWATVYPLPASTPG